MQDVWPESNLFVNMSVINLIIMVFSLFNWIFARFSFYFQIYNFILLPFIVCKLFDKREKGLAYYAFTVCYLVFFLIEQNGIIYQSNFIGAFQGKSLQAEMDINEIKIPKYIHYCWFGKGEKPDIVKKCIESWKANLSDYEIIEWNEENFDINSNDYVREAYKVKKFAFVSDYVRVYALYNHGGIYLDTDVEVFKSFDEIFNNESFWGFEQKII